MPPRVVSLLPSATELLCAVGGVHLLVGRSHECDAPTSIARLPVLTAQRTPLPEGNTTSADIDRSVREALDTTGDAASSQGDASNDRSLYHLDAALLADLAPDVILTQDLCNVCSIDLNTVRTIAEALSPRPAIVSLNPATLDDVFEDMLTVGRAVDLEHEARDALVQLRERYWAAREWVNAYIEGPEVAFLEWMDPLLVGGHWTPQLISDAGGRHSLNRAGAASRQIEPEELLEVMPDRLVICPCGYDLTAIQRELPNLTSQKWWSSLPAVIDRQVMLVDGNQMFNRPGPRLIDALEWLVGWLHDRPEVMPATFPVQPVRDALHR